jgi:hypothetical protein
VIDLAALEAEGWYCTLVLYARHSWWCWFLGVG